MSNQMMCQKAIFMAKQLVSRLSCVSCKAVSLRSDGNSRGRPRFVCSKCHKTCYGDTHPTVLAAIKQELESDLNMLSSMADSDAPPVDALVEFSTPSLNSLPRETEDALVKFPKPLLKSIPRENRKALVESPTSLFKSVPRESRSALVENQTPLLKSLPREIPNALVKSPTSSLKSLPREIQQSNLKKSPLMIENQPTSTAFKKKSTDTFIAMETTKKNNFEKITHDEYPQLPITRNQKIFNNQFSDDSSYSKEPDVDMDYMDESMLQMGFVAQLQEENERIKDTMKSLELKTDQTANFIHEAVNILMSRIDQLTSLIMDSKQTSYPDYTGKSKNTISLETIHAEPISKESPWIVAARRGKLAPITISEKAKDQNRFKALSESIPSYRKYETVEAFEAYQEAKKPQPKVRKLTQNQMERVKKGKSSKTLSPMTMLYFEGLRRNRPTEVRSFLYSLDIPKKHIRNISFVGANILEITTFLDCKVSIIKKLATQEVNYLPNFDPKSADNLKDNNRYGSLESHEERDAMAKKLFATRMLKTVERLPKTGVNNRLRNYYLSIIRNLDQPNTSSATTITNDAPKVIILSRPTPSEDHTMDIDEASSTTTDESFDLPNNDDIWDDDKPENSSQSSDDTLPTSGSKRTLSDRDDSSADERSLRKVSNDDSI